VEGMIVTTHGFANRRNSSAVEVKKINEDRNLTKGGGFSL
jgi:hypothetical protein